MDFSALSVPATLLVPLGCDISRDKSNEYTLIPLPAGPCGIRV